jgi:hypothetical protein
VTGADHVDLTGTGLAMLALAVFVVAYALVIAEESTGLRKSKPVVLAAGADLRCSPSASPPGNTACDAVPVAVERQPARISPSLLLFLLAAMTYVNAMASACVRGAALWLIQGQAGLVCVLFWTTGTLAFCISP